MVPCVDLTILCHLALLAISALMYERNKVSIFYQLGNDSFMILSILENATIIATEHYQNGTRFYQK